MSRKVCLLNWSDVCSSPWRRRCRWGRRRSWWTEMENVTIFTNIVVMANVISNLSSSSWKWVLWIIITIQDDDIHLKSEHLEGETLLIVGLGSRHLPVHQIDRNVLVDLKRIILVMKMFIPVILISTALSDHYHDAFEGCDDNNRWVFIILMMIMKMFIPMILTSTLLRVTMTSKLRVAAVTEAIKRAWSS